MSNDAEGGLRRNGLSGCYGAVRAEDITTSVPWAEFATGMCGRGGAQYLQLLRHYHLFKRTVSLGVPVPSLKSRAFPIPSAFQSSKAVSIFDPEKEAPGHLPWPGKLSDA